MAFTNRINPFSKLNDDTGFSTTGNLNGGRFINRDGSFNLRKTGWPFWRRKSLFYMMISVPIWQFITIILIFYLSINLVYATIYFLLGPDQFTGMIAQTGWKMFKEVFFFSTETFTTVGYGRVNPVGDAANIIAAIEALNGFLSFAIATGLIYGRFAKPKAYLAFSDNAVIAPYHGQTGLMFRFVCYKDHHALTDVNVKVNLAMMLVEDGHASYKYFELPLERSHVDNLPMNWTVVHPINEESPLSGFSLEDMRAADVEVYVSVRGFNDVYSSMVQQRTSYTFDEIKINHRFKPMYHETDDGTVLELHKLNHYVEQI